MRVNSKVSAIIYPAVIKKRLAQQYPEAALHSGNRTIKGMGTIFAGPFHRKPKISPGGHLNLNGGVDHPISARPLYLSQRGFNISKLTKADSLIGAG